MENSFDEFEVNIIEKEITKKSYRDIAFLLDRSVEEVTIFINQWLEGKEITSLQQLRDQAKKDRPPVIRSLKRKKNKKEDPLITSRIILPDQKQKKNRAGELIYKTREVDLSKMHEVKIDRRTWIYIKPGQNEEVVKKKYLQRLADCKSTFIENEKPTKEVKKFKPIK
jgi:hypothetical protein